MIDSRTFLSIFSRFQIALLFIMGFVGLWNNWIVNYYRDFSFLFAFLVVIPIIYRHMMSDNYRKEEFVGDKKLKKTYANGVCFVLIFGFLHSFYGILAGRLTLSIFVYFLYYQLYLFIVDFVKIFIWDY